MKYETLEDSSIEDELETKPVITVQTEFSKNLKLVMSVIDGYKSILERPPLSARWIDPTVPQSRYSPVCSEYIADVESAVRKVLRDKDDRVELRGAWNNLLQDSPVIGSRERRLVNLLVRIFSTNKLEPVRYFTVIKRRPA